MKLTESDVAALVFLSMENGKAVWRASLSPSNEGECIEVALVDLNRPIKSGDRLATLTVAILPVDSNASFVMAVWEVAKKLEIELSGGSMDCLLNTNFHRCKIGEYEND